MPNETWDQHMAFIGRPERTSGINAFVTSLVASDYFQPLTQYGVNPPRFLGMIPTAPNCASDALRDMTPPRVVQWNTLRSFAACQKNRTGTSADQLLIFVSPDLDVGEINVGPDRAAALCGAGIGSAYHAWGLGVPDFGVIPLNPLCNPNMQRIARSTSHEMVEILSDPAGFGYVHEVGAGRLWLGDMAVIYKTGEIGDICGPGG